MSLPYSAYAGRNGAKLDTAVCILLEGSLLGKKFHGPLDPALAAMGVTDEEWAKVQAKLAKSWSAMGRTSTIKAVEELNGTLFIAKGCFATFAEYNKGQKAMTVFTVEQWEALHPRRDSSNGGQTPTQPPVASSSDTPAEGEQSANGAVPAASEEPEVVEAAEATVEAVLEEAVEAVIEEAEMAREAAAAEPPPKDEEPREDADAAADGGAAPEEAPPDDEPAAGAAHEESAAATDPSQEEGEREAEAATSGEEPFVIRNLDTGEIITIPLDGSGEEQDLDPDEVRRKLTFGTISQNPEAWQALKSESRGLLEKLASKTTISFRSYQLCVWQERYVYAEDDALCYQHFSTDMEPVGVPKRIPYSTIEFVGPFDETQFVLKCANRAYTFLFETTESRTRWIKNISQLAGCSASTQVCHKTTTMGH